MREAPATIRLDRDDIVTLRLGIDTFSLSRMIVAAFNAGVDAASCDAPQLVLGGQLVELRLRFEDAFEGL